MRSLPPYLPLALASAGLMLVLSAIMAVSFPDLLSYQVRQWLIVLAALGLALTLSGNMWTLWQAVARLWAGGGWSGLATWAGLAWLSFFPTLLGALVLMLLLLGNWGGGWQGFAVSGPSEGYTFYYPNARAAQWAAAAELLTLWLGPALALLWLGRRLDA